MILLTLVYISESLSISSDRTTISNVINMKRASEIKSILKEICTSNEMKGLFDKEELSSLLLSKEIKWLEKCLEIVETPLLDIELGRNAAAGIKKYVGIDIIVNDNHNGRFLIDTGATMNLIRSDFTSKTGLSSQQNTAYTHGLGGSNSIGSYKTTINKFNVKNTRYCINNIEFTVLDNNNILPTGVDGLLGLSFLEHLNLVEFDFLNKILRFDPHFLSSSSSSSSSSSLLSPVKKSSYNEISTRRIYTGLVIADCYINNNYDESSKCSGMIDLGSTYTIANGKTVDLTKKSLDDLPSSPVVVVGIDNRPINLKNLQIDSIRIGDRHEVKPNISNNDKINIFAANMGGFDGIGLGSIAALIIGIDILGKEKMMLDIKRNKVYLQKQ